MSCEHPLISDIVPRTSALIRPVARVPIHIRAATLDDVAAIDALQKPETKNLGFLPRAALEGYVKNGDALVAEEMQPQRHRDTEEKKGSGSRYSQTQSGSDSVSLCLCGPPTILGYILFRDSSSGNDSCGYVVQLNVAREHRRSLVGAKLVQAALEQVAYGCRLMGCWCAQDLAANTFWESLGFVPLAFRTGSEKRGRTHIYWQKRVRADESGSTGVPPVNLTPYWYPWKTRGGQMRADRVAAPIPPGTHWRDAKPTILPGIGGIPMYEEEPEANHVLRRGLTAGCGSDVSEGEQEGSAGVLARMNASDKAGEDARAPRKRPKKKKKDDASNDKKLKRPVLGGGLRFPSAEEIEAMTNPPKKSASKKTVATKPKPKPAKRKYSEAFLAAAREFRDRFLESAHAAGGELLIADPRITGKYDVSRCIEGGTGLEGLLAPGMAADDNGPNAMQLPAADDLIDAEFAVRNAA